MDSIRKRVLKRAGCSRDRVGTLASLAQGKRTLDVGCTGARPQKGHSEVSLARHCRIAEAAAECLGLDIDEDGVAELNRMGFPAMVADACTCDLGRKFETIIAGELIEHLTHGARFLSNMGRHLEPGGRLVISTCNPFSTKRLWKILRYGHPAVHPKHTTWYDPLTLMELAARCGFVPKQLIWVQEQKGLDLRVLPRLLRRYYSGNFIIAFNLNRKQG